MSLSDAYHLLSGLGITLHAEAAAFAGGNSLVERTQRQLSQGDAVLPLPGAVWRAEATVLPAYAAEGPCYDMEIRFVLEQGSVPCGNVSVALRFSRWSVGNYVMMPAAAYNGNRFRVHLMRYPPYLHAEEGAAPDMSVTITDVPHLNADEGTSVLHLRSGDMATPAAAIRFEQSNEGILLLFEHISACGYTGLRLEENIDRSSALLRVEAPAVRDAMYTMGCSRAPSDDCGAAFTQGDTVTIRLRLLLFRCEDIPALFDCFFAHRKDLCASYDLEHGLPLSTAYRIIESKYNASQFNDAYQYYMLSPDGQGSKFGDWQAGWCGGGMNSFALYCDGKPLSRERANATMDSVFSSLQNKNGFILPIVSDGKTLGDDFCHQQRTGVLLVRKDGDVLAFAARHILLAKSRGETVPQGWLDGLSRLADAFVRLWDRHGQFGQFIDIETEEILCGGTACGSIVPGGLALAWKVLRKADFLRVAEASAAYYYERHVKVGLLNGGPGEILQNPDSESASNMLESFVILYELTGDRKWLPMAEDTARQCASWMVSYDFTFPAESCFGGLGMRTLGSVYANVQNKHSAPGFCTLSGASLLRLYRATGDGRYLQMERETAHNITQYLSREDRPIPTWDDEGKPMPPGWMCERVNMCDWEGKKNIGGVFYGGCWCEVSCLLTYAEVPGIWFLTDTGEAIVIDHVLCVVTDAGDAWQLSVHNPTKFDADVKLLCERRADFCIPWEQWVTDRSTVIHVPAGNCATVRVGKPVSSVLTGGGRSPDLSYNPG